MNQVFHIQHDQEVAASCKLQAASFYVMPEASYLNRQVLTDM
jgi:hypothetical protein